MLSLIRFTIERIHFLAFKNVSVLCVTASQMLWSLRTLFTPVLCAFLMPVCLEQVHVVLFSINLLVSLPPPLPTFHSLPLDSNQILHASLVLCRRHQVMLLRCRVVYKMKWGHHEPLALPFECPTAVERTVTLLVPDLTKIVNWEKQNAQKLCNSQFVLITVRSGEQTWHFAEVCERKINLWFVDSLTFLDTKEVNR